MNNVRYFDAVVIPGGSSRRIRACVSRCDASADNDYVYIDDVVISGCVSGARLGDPAPMIVADTFFRAEEEQQRQQAAPDKLSHESLPQPGTG